MATASAEAASGFTDVAAAARALLVDLLHLRAQLLQRIPEVARRMPALDVLVPAGGEGSSMAGAGAVRGKRKRSDSSSSTADESVDVPGHEPSADKLWSAVDAGWAAFAPYRDATIDKWGRKLAYAAGITSRQALKLKVLNADISKQVASVLQDRERLVARTRPARGAVRVLCQSTPSTNATAQPEDSSRDDELYEDSELYQALLKEYVSLAGGGGGTGIAGSGSAGRAGGNGYLKHTSRDGVDRRASKARRLRYVVHPKLVNFMAPAPYVVPPDAALDIDVILASLFQTQ